MRRGAPALHMAPVLYSSVLALYSTRPSLCSPLTAARAGAASALSCVAAIDRVAALSLAATSPCRRRLVLAARCTRCHLWRPSCVHRCPFPFSTRPLLCMPLTAARASAASALGYVAALVRAAAISLATGLPCRRQLSLTARCFVRQFSCSARLDPTLAPLAANRGSSQRRLGARLRRCARPRGSALVRRRLAMPAASCACCAMHHRYQWRPCCIRRYTCSLDLTLALLAADRGPSRRRLRARLRRCARPRGGALARRRLVMPSGARARGATHAALLMAPVLRSSVLVLVFSSTRPSLCSPLTAARAGAASALSCVAAIDRVAALSLAATSPCRRRLMLAARCTRCHLWRPSCVHRCLFPFSTRPLLCMPLTAARASAASALGYVAALVRAAALSFAAGSPCRRQLSLTARCFVRRCSCSPRIDPTLAPLAANRGSSQRRLGARLRRCDRPRSGALARRQLAMPAASFACCAMHHRCQWRPCCIRRCTCSLDPTLALFVADCGSSKRRLRARLHRGARPRGGALARRQLAMPAAARTRFAMHAASSMAPVLRSSVLVLSSTRPLLCSTLTAARASAA